MLSSPSLDCLEADSDFVLDFSVEKNVVISPRFSCHFSMYLRYFNMIWLCVFNLNEDSDVDVDDLQVICCNK